MDEILSCVSLVRHTANVDQIEPLSSEDKRCPTKCSHIHFACMFVSLFMYRKSQLRGNLNENVIMKNMQFVLLAFNLFN